MESDAWATWDIGKKPLARQRVRDDHNNRQPVCLLHFGLQAPIALLE
jgi:hypothetical protein